MKHLGPPAATVIHATKDPHASVVGEAIHGKPGRVGLVWDEGTGFEGPTTDLPIRGPGATNPRYQAKQLSHRRSKP